MSVLIHRSRNPKRGSISQGSAHDVATETAAFDLVVLCAEEFQPAQSLIATSRTRVIHAPNDDSEKPLTREQVKAAIGAAREAAKAYKQGKSILISCFMGRNRSGLVTALTLHILYGLSGDSAKAFIRTKIPSAIGNPHFERFLSKVPSREVSP